MDGNTIIRLCGSREKEPWYAACVSHWQDVFGDCEEFVEYYMDSTWKENQVLILPEKEYSIASMLHMNPYTLCVRDERLKLHYIVGVSTKKELRGRGYMGLLLKEAMRILKSQGDPFTYLMPAAVDIYKPYQFVPVGFTEETVRYVSVHETALRAAEVGKTCSGSAEGSLRLIPYGGLSEEQQEAISRFVMSNRRGVYVLPDVRYLRELERQVIAYDGELLTVWQGESAVGMAAYLYVESDMPPLEVVQSVFREGLEEPICEELHRHIGERFALKKAKIQYDMVPNIPAWRGTLSDAGGRQTCISMFRCLEPDWFLQRLARPAGWERECVVEITDTVLEENNGLYEVCFSEGQEKNLVRQSTARAGYCLNVEMLVQYWLRDTPVYTPELI